LTNSLRVSPDKQHIIFWDKQGGQELDGRLEMFDPAAGGS